MKEYFLLESKIFSPFVKIVRRTHYKLSYLRVELDGVTQSLIGQQLNYRNLRSAHNKSVIKRFSLVKQQNGSASNIYSDSVAGEWVKGAAPSLYNPKSLQDYMITFWAGRDLQVEPEIRNVFKEMPKLVVKTV